MTTVHMLSSLERPFPDAPRPSVDAQSHTHSRPYGDDVGVQAESREPEDWEPDAWDFDALGMSPAQWRDLEESALTYGALAQVETGLAQLPLPPGVAVALSNVLLCAVAHAHQPVVNDLAVANTALLDAASGVGVVQGFADGVMVQTARTLADRAGTELLERKRVGDPAELSATARERWRGKTKAVVAQELSVLTGLGIQTCHARVGFALAPPAAVGAAETALRRGVIGWRGINEYWQRCRSMDVDDAARVAGAVFSPLLTMEDADATDAVDTNTQDAKLNDVDTSAPESHRAESWAEFHRRLSREVTRAEGADAAAARARRRAAVDTRDVSGEICDDGLSALTITGGAASTAAAIERIETVARRARKAGDPRRLGLLRSDIAMALLVHGTLVLPERPPECLSTGPGSRERPSTEHGSAERLSTEGGSAERLSTEGGSAEHGLLLGSDPLADQDWDRDDDALTPWTAEIQRILSGLPTASIEVVVPITALSQPACPHGNIPGAGCCANVSVTENSVAEGPVVSESGRDAHIGARLSSPTGRQAKSNSVVGDITGHGFVTAEHARELATIPGSTWHRLLTDPADGRVVERSTAAYRPDQAMIDQLRAADRTCRAPGCLIPAHRCELDHEHPFGSPGGVTSETNLNPKHARHHQLKTEKFWTSVMDDTRQVRWTTMFEKMYVTKPHDYREYDSEESEEHQHQHPKQMKHPEHDAEQSAVADRSNFGSGQFSYVTAGAGEHVSRSLPRHPSTITDSDLRDRLVYAALSARGGQDRWLEAMDDQPMDSDFSYSWHPLAVFHRHHGRRRPGPPPDQSTPEELLMPPPPLTVEVKPKTHPPPPF